jgi:hypothetical protein
MSHHLFCILINLFLIFCQVKKNLYKYNLQFIKFHDLKVNYFSIRHHIYKLKIVDSKLRIDRDLAPYCYIFNLNNNLHFQTHTILFNPKFYD